MGCEFYVGLVAGWAVDWAVRGPVGLGAKLRAGLSWGLSPDQLRYLAVGLVAKMREGWAEPWAEG